MKLSDYAKKKGISYKTAWKWFKAGYIKGRQLPTGTILVEEESVLEPTSQNKCVLEVNFKPNDETEKLLKTLQKVFQKHSYEVLLVFLAKTKKVKKSKKGKGGDEK